MRNDPRRRDLATYPWTTALQTRFGDMDVNRHLNNIAVARLFEEVRVRFNTERRAASPDLAARFLIVRVEIDYLAEGLYPAPVVGGYGVAGLGTSSMRGALALFQEARCFALCDSVLVHRGAVGPEPLPPALRDELGEWLLRG